MSIEKGNSFPSSPKDRERFGIFDPTIVTPEYIEPEKAKKPPEGFDQFGRPLPGYKDSDFGEEGSTAPRQPEKDQRAPQNPDTQPQVAASETQATQAGNNLEQQEPTEPTEAELQARLAALEKRLKTEQRNMQNGLGGDPVGVQAQIEQIRKQIEQQQQQQQPEQVQKAS